MRVGDSLRLSELIVPAGVTLLDDPEETVLATVTAPTRVEEPEELPEGAEAAEAAEGAAAEPPVAEEAAGGEETVEG
jgi:large subunit ribosomal protein L25